MYALVIRSNGGFCALETDDPEVGTFETFNDALDFGGRLTADADESANPNLLWLSLAAEAAAQRAEMGEQQYEKVCEDILSYLDAFAPKSEGEDYF